MSVKLRCALHGEYHIFAHAIQKMYQFDSTQFKIESWQHARLGGRVHADAIMDRIIHNSITINAGDINIQEVESKMNKE